MIENSISVDLLSRLFSSQLITKGRRHLLDQDRTYWFRYSLKVIPTYWWKTCERYPGEKPTYRARRSTQIGRASCRERV